ncbi:MAG: mechanosensitive ion channel family protein [Candidatus Cyclobacteriaceae bacterium M2_1C_046]
MNFTRLISRKGAVFILLLLSSTILYAQKDTLQAEQLAAEPDTVGVVYLDNDSLFALFSGSGDLSVRERADWLTGKISTVSETFNLKEDSIYLNRQENKVWIYHNGNALTGISDEEAAQLGVTAEELAETYRTILLTHLKEAAWWERFQRSLFRALGAIAATLILLVVYRYLNRWFRKLRLFIRTKKDAWFSEIKIKQTTFLTPTKQLEWILWTLNAFKWFLFLFFGYLYLPIIFSIFPWTRGLADKLFGYILRPIGTAWDAFVNYLPNLFAIAVIIVIAYYINKFLKFISEEIKAGNLEIHGFYKDWADTTYKLVNIVVVVFTVIVIWPYIPGSDSDAFKGISIFVGVLLSLGSTGAISNIISGTVITYMRPFIVGDRVRITDTVGTIVEKSLLVTRIKTPKNVIITIPNAMILGSHIINYSNAAEEVGLVLHTNVTIGYDVPWQKVQEQLIAAAKEVDDVLSTPEPFVLQKALSDFYVDYELNAYTKTPERMEQIYSKLHQHIQDKFNEAGIEIMSPHYSAIRDGNQNTIPEKDLPKDYKTPAFRVENIINPKK